MITQGIVTLTPLAPCNAGGPFQTITLRQLGDSLTEFVISDPPSPPTTAHLPTIEAYRQQLKNATMDINGIIEGLERQGFWRVTVAQPATSAQDSESGADAESKDSLRAQLDMAEKALAVYEQKAAGHTTLTIPAPLVVNLEEMREKVARLGEELSE